MDFSANLKMILVLYLQQLCGHYGLKFFLILPPAIIPPPLIISSAHWPSGQTIARHAS